MYDLDQVVSCDDPDDIEALQRLQDLVNRFGAPPPKDTLLHAAQACCEVALSLVCIAP